MMLLVLFALIALANGLYEDYISRPAPEQKSVLFSSGSGAAWLLIVGYLWVMVVRRKTTHHFGIHSRNGWHMQLMTVPKHAAFILNLLQAGALLLGGLLMLGNQPLALLLATPGAVILLGPHSWLGLDVDVHSEISAPWSSCQRVLIDRQNNRVAVCVADSNEGFDAYLPEHLLDSYLGTLKSLLPGDALFVQIR